MATHVKTPHQLQESGTGLVHSLAKGLEILSCFSEGELLGNQQLVELTGLPKATVSRLTSTLVKLGYLQVDPRSRKLAMGARVLGLGVSVQRKLGLQRIARPHMEAMSQRFGLTVTMGTRDRLSVVLLEVCRPPSLASLVVNFDAGTHLPLSQTALGLASLVNTPVKDREQVIEGLRKQLGDQWVEARNRIERAHQEHERYGYIVSQRSLGRDVSGVAVGMVPMGSNTPYVFHMAGPSNQMPLSLMRSDMGPALKQMVQDIQAEMRAARPPKLVVPKEF
jgi:DNA-binding IclR family transcriptional regulator